MLFTDPHILVTLSDSSLQEITISRVQLEIGPYFLRGHLIQEKVLAVCRVKAVHKQTPSTHLPDTHPVKESGRVRCRHLCQVCCPLKDRPTAIWNGAQILHHACINQYDSLLGEVNGWKWID